MSLYDHGFLRSFLLSSVGRTFFVDFTGGNDGNGGRAATDAWKTIGKVNGSTFLPGDTILFKRGETWAGVTLDITWSNVTVDAYGAGADPIIDGSDAVNCITITNRHHVVIRNIECTQGLDFGIVFATCHDCAVVDCSCHDCGNDNLNFITTCYNCVVIGGTFYNAYSRVADGRTVAGIEIADGCHGIAISGSECYNQIDTGMGITVHSHAATIFPYNITIDNCYCYGNAGMGIRMSKADATADADRNITVENCRCHANTLDGIQATYSGAEPINGLTIRDNLCYLNLRWGISLRGDNFDIYRNTITTNNAGAQTCVALDGISTGTFYNNTMYDTNAAFFGIIVISNARTANLAVKNNIVSASNANPYMLQVAAGTGVVGLDIDYNLYSYTGAGLRWTWLGANSDWAGWLLASGQDANSHAPADPLFTNPGGNDFTLQAGSPAIGAGVDVGLPYCGTAPDCGAYEVC